MMCGRLNSENVTRRMCPDSPWQAHPYSDDYGEASRPYRISDESFDRYRGVLLPLTDNPAQLS
jgi:hypothetical protein